MDEFLNCRLCPRQCGVNRYEKAGYCGMGSQPKLARAALHFWEEPCISGKRGSGAVFFSGCTLGCVFCQNARISHDGWGIEITKERLSDIFKELIDQGAHNLNLVTGTPFVPVILDALDICHPAVPVVWNTGGYESLRTLKMLEGAVQVYLPDLKHVSPRLSSLCAKAPDYFEKASQALLEMHRQTGDNQYDEEGMLQKGMIVRHLILPGCTMDAMKVLDFLAENLPSVPVSIMHQYTPSPRCHVKGLDRPITEGEYKRVMAHAAMLHIQGFSQEEASSDQCFTPPFDGTGVEA